MHDALTIIGGGDMLDVAWHAWSAARPDLRVERREARQMQDYTFDLAVFEGLDPRERELFVAFDERFGNFKRLELMQAAQDRGFRPGAFVSPHAVVGQGVDIGSNVFIGDRVVLGAGTMVESNSVILAAAVIGISAHLGPSCWIETGVVVGNRARIGAHATLRTGVAISAHLSIGRNCELGIAGVYREDVAPGTIFDPRYDEPLRVYGA